MSLFCFRRLFEVYRVATGEVCQAGNWLGLSWMMVMRSDVSKDVPKLTDVEHTLPLEPFEDYQPNIKLVRKNVLYPLSNTNKSTIFASFSRLTK